jgi:aspartyl-tRNA(Asn)/glutamyl-tRNA(Gln) amidotransferase subunit A
VLLGKVHLHELALGITGESLATPRNPLDSSRLPGGSSSGSAVSVAAGMALASLGTDTGGSVRVPAALCGVVGFKPTFGWMGRGGLAPLAWSMDHVGLIGRTVEDVGLVTGFRATKGPLKVAAMEEGLGYERVSLPGLEEAFETYGTIVRYEAARVHARELDRRPEIFGEDVRELLLAGAALSLADYVRALDRRAAFARSLDAVLRRYDCLVTPTTLVAAPARGASVVEVRGRQVTVREALLRCTCPFSMVGVPALAVGGLQVIGAWGGEGAVLATGGALERNVG